MSDLMRKLEESNFSKEEIESILDLVKKNGGIEEANELLRKLINKIE